MTAPVEGVLVPRDDHRDMQNQLAYLRARIDLVEARLRHEKMRNSALVAELVDPIVRAKLLQPPGPVVIAPDINTPVPDQFLAYMRTNYPGPRTIISDPNWHAPKIWRAALFALRELMAARAVEATTAPAPAAMEGAPHGG